MTDKYIIACVRVEQFKPRTNSIRSYCDNCKWAIWVANSTPILPNAIYLCLKCVPWDEIENIEAPTAEQIRDVKRIVGH
jgi:hypothetical protein